MFSALPPKADLRQASNDITFGDLQLRTRTGCGHRAPTTVRRSAISNLGALQRVVCAWLLIAVSSTTSLEIDMSKPHLLLIHCSDGIPAGAKGRQRGRSFRPLVIRGGARARSVPRQSSWEAALELIDLGFLVSHASYLAFMQASLTVLEAYNWTDPERNS